jgi:hypothetical protein
MKNFLRQFVGTSLHGELGHRDVLVVLVVVVVVALLTALILLVLLDREFLLRLLVLASLDLQLLVVARAIFVIAAVDRIGQLGILVDNLSNTNTLPLELLEALVEELLSL